MNSKFVFDKILKESTQDKNYVFLPFGQVGYFLETFYDENGLIDVDEYIGCYIFSFNGIKRIVDNFDIEDSEIFEYPKEISVPSEYTDKICLVRDRLTKVDKSLFQNGSKDHGIAIIVPQQQDDYKKLLWRQLEGEEHPFSGYVDDQKAFVMPAYDDLERRLGIQLKIYECPSNLLLNGQWKLKSSELQLLKPKIHESVDDLQLIVNAIKHNRYRNVSIDTKRDGTKYILMTRPGESIEIYKNTNNFKLIHYTYMDRQEVYTKSLDIDELISEIRSLYTYGYHPN